ncbi:MAG: YigZ family protein [Clostridia bacterium]|nr:YigZ family protein [Clostridia bacterium]
MDETKPYKTVAAPAEAEYIEKKSRFIATVSPVSDDDSAREFVAAVKKRYPDARHNVYAYLTLDGMTRYSDDGEPKGTAGLPVLGVLQKQQLCGVAVVVTRYFGGILLGAAGLLRAYTKAASDGVEAAGVVEVRPYDLLRVTVSFSDAERIRYELTRRNASFTVEYAENVTFLITSPEETTSDLVARLTELTAAKAAVTVTGKIMKG